MSKSSWTYYGGVNRVSDEHGRTIADLDDSDFDFPEDFKHGLLFAAAPELLEACKEALPFIADSYPPPVHDGPCTPESGCDAGCMELAAIARVVWKIKSAIAKAEGGPS